MKLSIHSENVRSTEPSALLQYSVVAQKMEVPSLLPLAALLQPWLGEVMGVSSNGKKEGKARHAKTSCGKSLVSAVERNSKVSVAMCHEHKGGWHKPM